MVAAGGGSVTSNVTPGERYGRRCVFAGANTHLRPYRTGSSVSRNKWSSIQAASRIANVKK
jgi:hypothetical protein